MPKGHGRSHTTPRSCGDRHCPDCQGAKAREWLDDQLARLLPCAYFLVTFTLPPELRELARALPRAIYTTLFEAAADALRELASNPRYVGSDQLGFTGVLHTWGRDLAYHPHVHFVVPGGALSADGQEWLPSRADFLVPVHALSKLFRAKFRERLEELGLSDRVPAAAWNRPWVVHSAAVGDGRQALRYLAPYVFRVAISPRRIVRCEPGPDGLGRVTFTYRKSGQSRYRAMTVTADEFLRRFLQHVLPRGLQKVRHYGFAHPRRRIDHEWLAMLVTVTLHLIYELRVGLTASRPRPPSPACPTCGGPLICRGLVPAFGAARRPDDTS